MGIHLRVIASIGVLVALICLAMLLRRLSLLEEGHGKIFSRLVTHVTLPALIFASLAQTAIPWDELLLAFYMFAAELICLSLGWVIGRLMKLDAPRMGSVIIATGFGSSSLLGYAVISEVFRGSAGASTEAVIVSEIGVGPSLFTLGTAIAMYYGRSEAEPGARLQAAAQFFVSPIVFSLVAGILFSLLVGPDHNAFLAIVLQGVHVAGAANTFVVALTVGLLLHLTSFRDIAFVGGLVCLVKLIVQPVLLWLPTFATALQGWQIQVLILEAAMPSAMLTVVLASSYGCDAKLASRIVFMTTLLSIVTLPLIFGLLV
jgi:predicted permease